MQLWEIKLDWLLLYMVLENDALASGCRIPFLGDDAQQNNKNLRIKRKELMTSGWAHGIDSLRKQFWLGNGASLGQFFWQIEMQFLRGLSVIAKLLQLKTVAWSIASRTCHMMQKELFSSAKCISLGYLAQQIQKKISRMKWKVFIC